MIEVQGGRGRQADPAKDQLINEAVAIAVLVLSVFMFLALATNRGSANLVGRAGSFISGGLTYAVGQYVAYVVPLLVLLTAWQVWRGQGLRRAGIRLIGLYGAVASICAMLATPYAHTNFDIQEGFRVGGALGNFLVHERCLNLAGLLGNAGAYLIFLSLLVVSVSTATDVRVKDFLRVSKAALVHLLDGNGLASVRAKLSGLVSRPAASPVATADAAQPMQPVGAAPAAMPAETVSRSSRLSAGFSAPVTPVATAPSAAPAPAAPLVAPALQAAHAVSPVAPAAPAAPIAPAMAAPPAAKASAPALGGLPTLAESDDEDDLFSAAAPPQAAQSELELIQPYLRPQVTILNAPPTVVNAMTNEEVAEICERLEKTLGEFGISAEVVQVTQGPTVTRYEIQPAPGIKVAKIASLENDIAMCMKAESVRIIAPVPGKGTVGLEIPNKTSKPVFLREMLETDAFTNHQSPLAFALGMTISGEPYICDLASMPHVLIAGRTGSGKSVCLNSIICSILFRMTPDKVKFLMVDPKRVELNVYQAIPHLLAPVVCEPRKAAAALTWAVEQMDERYKKLAAVGVRNIDGYNAIVQSDTPHPKAVGRQLSYMPHIVIVIDELADLMLIARNEVEDNIIRLAQMSRAVGMHLILATQRPSVNVITGIIKANFPSRVAFQVSSKVDSRTILDAMGAEALLGRGDMLFSPGGSPRPIRLQGCYVSDQEVEATADWVRAQAKVQYEMQDFLTKKEQEELRAQQHLAANDMLAMDGIDADDRAVARSDESGDDYDYTYQQQRQDGLSISEVLRRNAAPAAPRAAGSEEGDAIDEELFAQAARLILTHRKASVSLLQRKLKIGFARAGRVMDMLEERGIVGPNVGSKVREILIDPEEYEAELEGDDEEDVRF